MTEDAHSPLGNARSMGAGFPFLMAARQTPVEDLSVEMPAGPRRAFGRGRIATYGDLADLTVDDLRDIQSVGESTLAEINALLESAQNLWESRSALEQDDKGSHQPLPTIEPDPMESWLDHAPPDLRLVAEWAATTRRARSWGRVWRALDEGDLPVDVLEAQTRLDGTPTGVQGPAAADVMNGWLRGLDDRSRDIATGRLAGRKATLDELGLRHGVTRERIRQLESKLKVALEELLQHSPEWRVVRWTVHDLRHRCGGCAPVDAFEDLDLGDVAARLLLKLAGLSLNTFPASLTADGFVLPDVEGYVQPPDDVLIDENALGADLLDVGVGPEHLPHVVGLLDVARIEGKLVVWRGNIVDRSIAQLAARGEPMGSVDLLPLTGGRSEPGLRDRLLQDPRVHRVNRDDFALRSWGMPEYTRVVDHMLEVLDETGGSVWLDDLAERLECDFGIKKGSTMAYAAAPVFVVHDGLIWRRHEDEPYPVSRDVAGARGLYRIGPRAVSWLVPVDGELSRGSGRPAPQSLAWVLGIAPGERLTFGGGGPDVTISWNMRSHMGPTCSSLRPVMEHLGAVGGDMIRLAFYAEAGRCDAQRVLAEAEGSPRERLQRRTGLTVSDGHAMIGVLAEALGVAAAQVRGALLQRGDDTVATLLRGLTQDQEQDADERRATMVDRQQEASA